MSGAGRKVGVIDTTLRDGQQSLWATRMTTAMTLEVLPLLDRAGFETVEVMATVVMDSSVRYLKENPWERLRILRRTIKHTPIGMMGGNVFSVTSQGILPDDLLTMFISRCAANGVDRFFLMDGLNDARNMEVPVRAAKTAGAYVWGALTYSISPAHTDEHFVARIGDIAKLGVDAIVLKDPNGLLTPERLSVLMPKLRAAAGGLEVYCHSHCNTGMGPASALEAVRQGAAGVWTATPPLSNGASLPSTPTVVRGLEAMGHEVGVDLELVAEASRILHDMAVSHGKPLGVPAEYDSRLYEHQMPGGMISNFRSQLRDLGIEHRIDEVFAEIPRVREDLGWAIMVTPFSQVLATQATLNVLYGRYEVVPEGVKRLALGYYGQTPAPISQDVIDRIGGGEAPITQRPGEVIPPVVGRLREQFGAGMADEDLVLRALFMPEMIEALEAAGPIEERYRRPASIADIVRDVSSNGTIRSMHLSMR